MTWVEGVGMTWEGMTGGDCFWYTGEAHGGLREVEGRMWMGREMRVCYVRECVGRGKTRRRYIVGGGAEAGVADGLAESGRGRHAGRQLRIYVYGAQAEVAEGGCADVCGVYCAVHLVVLASGSERSVAAERGGCAGSACAYGGWAAGYWADRHYVVADRGQCRFVVGVVWAARRCGQGGGCAGGQGGCAGGVVVGIAGEDVWGFAG